MKLKELKKDIEKYLNEGNLDLAEELIRKVEVKFKGTMEYYVFKGIFYYLKQEYEIARDIMNKGLREYPFSLDLRYNLAIVCLVERNYIEATREFLECYKIYQTTPVEERTINLEINSLLTDIVEQINSSNLDHNEKKQRLEEVQQIINSYEDILRYSSYKDFPNKYRDTQETYLGKDFTLNGKKYFVGLGDHGVIETNGIEIDHIDLKNIWMKSEILEYIDNYEITGGSREQRAIIPIVTKKMNTEFKIRENEKEYKVTQKIPDRFYYYKVEGNYQITSLDEIIIGKPLLLDKKRKNKDLILNIFIDGLSQAFLELEGMHQLMPNTYNFFRQGTICSQVYANSEWTLPSVATICTGQYVNKHHIFHPSRNVEISQEIKLISEIFKEEGYVTSHINGDWRISPLYGYIRGIDRMIYQPTVLEMKARDIIGEGIEQLETFKEANQYVWLSFMDLHKVGDGEIDSMWAQTKMRLWKQNNNVEDTNKSVKLEFSEIKIEQYKKAIIELDRQLQILYSYLEENFDLKNSVITLMSDHGQSYLENNEYGQYGTMRTKVPLMIRDGVHCGKVDELIQLTDYIAILTSLAGIEIDMKKRDCQLPMYFGGDSQREYTYFESVFPGDIYTAVINTDEHIIYFETKDKVKADGRVNMDLNTIKIINRENKEIITSEELECSYKKIILDHMKFNRIYEE